ncbi:MAG TPA: hypothetical protein VK817_24490 [Trebonia sp.]|nr:hypothetical protein [Trebonia sp.]
MAAWAVAVAVVFTVYLRLAGTRAVNSDGSSQALQAWDMLHGNELLRGWMLTDVSFYTTEIPEYALVELVRGLGPDVVRIAAAATYALVVVLGALLAKGTATGRAAAFRIAAAAGIMLAPQLGAGTDVLLSSPDHIGTSVPVLVTWLVLDRSRPRWWVPAVTTVLLAWSLIGDQLVLVVAILPLIAVCALRAGRVLAGRRPDGSATHVALWRATWYEAALAAGAVVAALAGTAAPRVIRGLGGYDVQPVGSQLAPLHTIASHNLPLVGDGFLLLGGAYFTGLPAGWHTWFIMLHVVGVAMAGAGIGVTAWRLRRGEDLVPQLMLVGIMLNVLAYAAGTHTANLADTREMAPVLPLAAALAGRQLPRYLTACPRVGRVAVPVLGLALAGYLAGLGLELRVPAAPPQNASLTSWLTRHHFGTGLSTYWTANVVTLTSGEKVSVRPVRVIHGRVVPYFNNSRTSWYDPDRSYADYLVMGPGEPGYPGFGDWASTERTFGHPAMIYRVGAYRILVWHENLLTDMRR